MKRFSLVPILVALTFASPARIHAQDEGDKPDKKEEKKPADNPRGRGGRQWGGLPIDQLKEKLALSDDQVKKLEQINEESNAQFRKEMQELQKDGNFDYQKMREIMPKRMAEMRDKVKAILTDEQKAKFDEWAKEAEKQQRRGPGFGRDPEAMKARLLEQAQKELALTADEKTAVVPLLQRLLDARAEARVNGDKRREEFTQFVKKVGGADEAQKAELQKKLDEFRKAREAEQAKIKDAQSALREVLTIENEAKLVALGILD
jgi:Spy/CpxP family protein refolding chaperone